MQTKTHIVLRALAALLTVGFSAQSVKAEALGSVGRLAFSDGPALNEKFILAGLALDEEGIGYEVHPKQRAIVVFSKAIIGEGTEVRRDVAPRSALV